MENVRETYRKILAQKYVHETLRYQMELSIETTPRDSRYSQQLVDMMHKEENHGRENRQNTDLTKRVDDALNHETTAFFSKVVQSNTKKWNAFKTKLDQEREGLRQDIIRTNYNNNMTNTDAIQPTPSISLDKIELESKRLEQIYNDRWYEFEGFNLEEAFRAQKTRLETEWDAHRLTLSDSFRTRKKALLGTTDAMEVPSSRDSHKSQDVRWHHPEKQRTLIHTAPVLTPSILVSKDATEREKAVGSAVRAVRSRVGDGPVSAVQQQLQLELDSLESEYKKSLDAMDQQKGAALRWMNRQKIRLLAQAQVVQTERRAIGAVLQSEIVHLMAMARLIGISDCADIFPAGALPGSTGAPTSSAGVGGGSGHGSVRTGELPSASGLLGSSSNSRKEPPLKNSPLPLNLSSPGRPVR